MNINEKLEILNIIAIKFNQNNITWAIGGSLLLYFNNITEHFNDIDLMICEQDAIKAKELLSDIAILLAQKNSEQFKTKHFYQFNLNNLNIDLMAGFTIIINNKTHYYPLLNNDITNIITINNNVLPLHSISVWRTLYQLMDRVDKVKLIDDSNYSLNKYI